MILKIGIKKINISDFNLIFFYMFSFIVVSEFADSFPIKLKHLFVIIAMISVMINKGMRKGENQKIVIIIFLMGMNALFQMIINFFPDGLGGGLITLFSIGILFVPLYIGNFLFGDRGIKIGGGLTFLAGFAIIFLWSNFGFLANWNTNSLGYLAFFGISCGVLLFYSFKHFMVRTLIIILLIYAGFMVQKTDSRNVTMAYVLLIILTVFNKVFDKKWIYRGIYIFSISYCYLFPKFSILFVNSNDSKAVQLYQKIVLITQEYFNKESGIFSGRINIWTRGFEMIHDTTWNFLFGHGAMLNTLPAHNNYIPIVYSFGIVGAIAIAIILIMIFEKAYRLKVQGDKIAYGCATILIGTFVQLGAEGFLFAINTLTLMPFVFMGIILGREYQKRRRFE